ncbi:MAG: signal peptidase II [Rhodospirillales bacterium]
MRSSNGLPLGLVVAALLIVLDQATKWWIMAVVMQPPRIIPVTPFFNLVMGWNRGISFGLFDGDSALNVWILPLVALAIVAALVVWLRRVQGAWLASAIGLVIGGAIGNVVDRLRFGAVADFLDFHVAGYHWPAFNAADSGITVGVAMLVLDSLFMGAEKPKNKGGTDAKEG